MEIICPPPEDSIWDDSTDLWVPVNVDILSPTPSCVRPAPPLSQDSESLSALFQAPAPPLCYLRLTHMSVCIYGFVDASGAGFGSSFQLPTGNLLFRQGLWGRDADNMSSNYRELWNLVEALEDGIAAGDLTNTEVFMFTDNSTAEGAYYHGNTPSKTLFELVLHLRQLDLHGGVKLHVIHVAGTRMISQRTDALSRGMCTEGVMAGESMLSLIPLHLSAISRSPAVLHWIQSWCPISTIQLLTPSEWFERGHGIQGGALNDDGIWIPLETGEQRLL